MGKGFIHLVHTQKSGKIDPPPCTHAYFFNPPICVRTFDAYPPSYKTSTFNPRGNNQGLIILRCVIKQIDSVLCCMIVGLIAEVLKVAYKLVPTVLLLPVVGLLV